MTLPSSPNLDFAYHKKLKEKKEKMITKHEFKSKLFGDYSYLIGHESLSYALHVSERSSRKGIPFDG